MSAIQTAGRFEQRGLSLIELMVALALGSFLILGVVMVLLSTKKSSQVESALARVQENGRIALDILSDDIRRAHYTGCNSVHGGVTVIAKSVVHEGLRGYQYTDGDWSPALDPNDPVLSGLTTEVREGSDLLNLHIATHLGDDLLTSNVVPSSTSVSLSDNPGCAIEAGNIVVVSNCLTAHVLRVDPNPVCADPTAVTPTALNLTAGGNFSVPIEPGYRYDSKSEIMLYGSVAWYVADTGRTRNDSPVFALYRRENGDTPQEMIEGVEVMQLRYGQRSGTELAPATRYVTASDGTLDWEEVTSIRIGLLIRSYEQVGDTEDTRSYVLLDPNNPVAFDPGSPAGHDGGFALRQVFRTTAAIRNTAFGT